MISLDKICDFLNQFAPLELAEDWDNVGLLVGDRSAEVSRIMTCLTVTPESVEEAIAGQADLIVTHHPLPFQPIRKLTNESTPTKLLLELIRAGIAIYSPHTGFDSSKSGINQMICQRIGLQDIKPLVPAAAGASDLGSGRFGRMDSVTELASFMDNLKQQFAIEHLQYVGDLKATVSVVASACGSGGSFLDAAVLVGCNTFLTGEANFHTCLEAKARNISLILLGHYSSERFAIEVLSDVIQSQFSDLKVWCSAKESDPLNFA